MHGMSRFYKQAGIRDWARALFKKKPPGPRPPWAPIDTTLQRRPFQELGAYSLPILAAGATGGATYALTGDPTATAISSAAGVLGFNRANTRRFFSRDQARAVTNLRNLDSRLATDGAVPHATWRHHTPRYGKNDPVDHAIDFSGMDRQAAREAIANKVKALTDTRSDMRDMSIAKALWPTVAGTGAGIALGSAKDVAAVVGSIGDNLVGVRDPERRQVLETERTELQAHALALNHTIAAAESADNFDHRAIAPERRKLQRVRLRIAALTGQLDGAAAITGELSQLLAAAKGTVTEGERAASGAADASGHAADMAEGFTKIPSAMSDTAKAVRVAGVAILTYGAGNLLLALLRYRDRRREREDRS